MLTTCKFLSTPSARRATEPRQQQPRPVPISIHALREEGDCLPSVSPPSVFPISIHALREEGDLSGYVLERKVGSDFYPRPPRGGRLHASRQPSPFFTFLSTPSARRATPRSRSSATSLSNFYPRPPRGGRPKTLIRAGWIDEISIHALREEGDLLSMGIVPGMCLFLSTPSARRATPTR